MSDLPLQQCPPSQTGPRNQKGQRLRRDQGQTTAEYALVLLAAGTIAMLVIAWAQDNNSIGALFDAVIDKITSLVV